MPSSGQFKTTHTLTDVNPEAKADPEVYVDYKGFDESIDDEDFNISHLSEDTSCDNSQLYEQGDLRQSLDTFLESWSTRRPITIQNKNKPI